MTVYCRCPKNYNCFPLVAITEYATVLNIMDTTRCRSVRYTVDCITVICDRVHTHIEVKMLGGMNIPAKYVDTYLLWMNILARYRFTRFGCQGQYMQDVVLITRDDIWMDDQHITPCMPILETHSSEAIKHITALSLAQRDDLLY